jgi:hypothetical protein
MIIFRFYFFLSVMKNIKIMSVCSDLTTQQRTVRGVQIPVGGKVIVGARKKESNCRYQGFSSWDFWNKKKVCDHKWQNKITFENAGLYDYCNIKFDQGVKVKWHTDPNEHITKLLYNTGLDLFWPSMTCAKPKKYSNRSYGHFQCTQRSTGGQMTCTCIQGKSYTNPDVR